MPSSSLYLKTSVRKSPVFTLKECEESRVCWRKLFTACWPAEPERDALLRPRALEQRGETLSGERLEKDGMSKINGAWENIRSEWPFSQSPEQDSARLTSHMPSVCCVEVVQRSKTGKKQNNNNKEIKGMWQEQPENLMVKTSRQNGGGTVSSPERNTRRGKKIRPETE